MIPAKRSTPQEENLHHKLCLSGSLSEKVARLETRRVLSSDRVNGIVYGLFLKERGLQNNGLQISTT